MNDVTNILYLRDVIYECSRKEAHLYLSGTLEAVVHNLLGTNHNGVTQIWIIFDPSPPSVTHLCPRFYALVSRKALPTPPLCVTSFIKDSSLVADHLLIKFK